MVLFEFVYFCCHICIFALSSSSHLKTSGPRMTQDTQQAQFQAVIQTGNANICKTLNIARKFFYNACKSKTCTTNDFKLIWLLVKEKHRKKKMWWSCLACNLSPEFPCFSERELVLHECRLTLDAPSLHIVDEWFFGVKITFSVTLLSTRSSFNIPFQLNFFLPELNVINARYEQ